MGLQGLTNTAHGAMALVGDRVRGICFVPPLVDKVILGSGVSPKVLDPANKKVDPGSFTTEPGCDGIEVLKG